MDEFKRRVIKDFEKALDKMNNGYTVNLDSINDLITFINYNNGVL